MQVIIAIVFFLVFSAAAPVDVSSAVDAARASRRAGDLAGAEAAYRTAFDLALARPLERLTVISVELANFYSQQGRLDQSESFLKRALEAEDRAGAPAAVEIPVATNLADVYLRE